jgi:hypothetical protein
MHLEWIKAARDDEAASAFLDRYVREPTDQAEYLAVAGGAETLLRIGQWEAK